MLRYVSLILIVLTSIAQAVLSGAQAEKPNTRPAVVSGAERSNAQPTTLRVGTMNPEAPRHSPAAQVERLRTMDQDILARVAQAAGMKIALTQLDWTQQQEALLSGRIDAAFGAYQPDFGDARFHYSIPYRQSPMALYIRAEDKGRHDLSDVFTQLGENDTLRLGVVAGQSFQDTRIYRAFESAGRERRLVVAHDLEENLKNLMEGRIDAFIGERLGTTASAIRMQVSSALHETVLPDAWNVHVIFSKTTVPQETVEKFNAAITAATNSGELRKIIHRNVFSVIATYFFNSILFFSLDVIGTIAFAISGVLIAYRERFSIVGAFVLSALPAVGGGALRDLIFDRHPIGVLTTPLYLSLVGLTVLIGFAVIRLVLMLQRRRYWFDAGIKFPAFVNIKNIYECTDAIGLGAFTVSGVAVAVFVGADPLWLWVPISATLSAAGGGILRDIVRQSGRIETLKTEFYAEVPVIWGTLFSLFILVQPALVVPETFVMAIIIMLFGAMLTRLAAVWLGIRAVRYW